MKSFSKEDMVGLLVEWDQTLNPGDYSETRKLSTEDFVDAAVCKAIELGIEKEFEQARLAKASG